MSLKDLSSSLGSQQVKQKPKTFDTKAQIKTIPAYKLLAIQFPDEFVDDINDHIDNVIIPSNVSHESQLVGQINQSEKSAQWTFPLDSKIGKDFKTVINSCATSLLKDKLGYNRDSVAEAFEAWTVHSYSGDYNPLHAHGCQTPSGLSMIMYLKVPSVLKINHNFHHCIMHLATLMDLQV